MNFIFFTWCSEFVTILFLFCVFFMYFVCVVRPPATDRAGG